jgi:SulP family sulfate permease
MTRATGGAASKRRRFPLPLFEGILPIDKAGVPKEVIAGITLGALAIPEVMGYANIAGMPVITGLYTILVPIAVFAVLGSSRHLVVGADSATAAILAAGLAGMAATGSAQYIALAGMLALMAGGFLLLARVLRLGFIADFLSRTVLIGFLTGVGIQVACGQFAGLFGLTKTGGNPVTQVVNAFKDMGSASLTTLAVSVAVLLVIIVGGKLAPKIPWALLAVIGAIIASAALDLSAHGVSTLGTIPSGLPHFGFPSIPSSDYIKLIGTAGSIFVVVLAQSAATSRAYAAKYSDAFDENVDLVGLGVSSITAGLSGTFVVNGSPTKTEMVDSAGGKSQLAMITTSIIVLIVLLFLTKPLSYMPNAVLAAVVFLIGVRLVDVKGMKGILQSRPAEFWVALITAAVVIFVGVEQGIILAIVLSIVVHLHHSYRPYDRLLVSGPSGALKAVPLHKGSALAPGLAVYRFGAALYYANANLFSEEVLGIVAVAKPPLEWFCLSADGVGDIDYSGSAALRVIVKELERRRITFILCDVDDPVLAELERDGLIELIGKANIYDGVQDVLAGFKARPADGQGTPPHTQTPTSPSSPST